MCTFKKLVSLLWSKTRNKRAKCSYWQVWIHLKTLNLFYIRPQGCNSFLFHRRGTRTSVISIVASSLMILAFLSLF